MIDHLLSLQESQPEYYTDQIIKGLILVLLGAGTDTMAVTLEREEIIKSMDRFSKLAHDSISPGGSSYNNLEKLIEDLRRI
ncbi:hypothetical protein CMV_010955 [Castanea mollissima]|uniref:Cytochrome P450 n=1 Tax=Castanea mollissima TaxID=60419 RepID=A0A8J4R4P0_9ROSI|nr:hypothetical protein CMV_010955 [Castanea mollissima]